MHHPAGAALVLPAQGRRHEALHSGIGATEATLVSLAAIVTVKMSDMREVPQRSKDEEVHNHHIKEEDGTSISAR